MGIVNEDNLNKFTEKAINKIWNYFMSFGTFGAGIMTIIFNFNTVKYILNTIIHGYTLYSIYGASLRMLRTFWGTVANILIHLGH